MAAQSKAQLLTEVHTHLKRHYKMEPRASRFTVLEAVIFGICHEGTTREQANQAMSRFKDEFFDWNEVRVSSLVEIQGVLAGLPDPEGRAYAIRRFLRQLFEKTYGFALDGLTKKPLKDAVKSLQEFEALKSDYVLAAVIQLALGGHAIPVDMPIRRGLERLGIADHNVDSVALRSVLERAVPKNRGVEFCDLMEELTHDTCVDGTPNCPACDLRKLCPTGHARMTQKAPAKAAGTKGTKGKAVESAAPKGKAAKPKAAASRDGKSARPAKPPAPKAKSKPPASGKPKPKGKSRGK
jgi:endonuclease-3